MMPDYELDPEFLTDARRALAEQTRILEQNGGWENIQSVREELDQVVESLGGWEQVRSDHNRLMRDVSTAELLRHRLDSLIPNATQNTAYMLAGSGVRVTRRSNLEHTFASSERPGSPERRPANRVPDAFRNLILKHIPSDGSWINRDALLLTAGYSRSNGRAQRQLAMLARDGTLESHRRKGYRLSGTAAD